MTQTKTWETVLQRLSAAQTALETATYRVIRPVPRHPRLAQLLAAVPAVTVANGDGRAYQVRYDPQAQLATCNCPDFTARGGVCCKHTLMAMLSVWPEHLAAHLAVLEELCRTPPEPPPAAPGPTWARAATLGVQLQVAEDADAEAAYPAAAPAEEDSAPPPSYPSHWEQLATGQFKWCRLPMVTLERLLAFSLADSLTQILTARLGVTAPVAQELGDQLLTKVVHSLRHQIWLEERARYNTPESYC